ncbi:hypothetical protein GCM10009596_01920 [Arthrobacter rhombi]
MNTNTGRLKKGAILIRKTGPFPEEAVWIGESWIRSEPAKGDRAANCRGAVYYRLEDGGQDERDQRPRVHSHRRHGCSDRPR